MKTLAAMAAFFVLVSGAAQAQVSTDAYPKIYDYIMDHDWYCLTKQPFGEVDDGELQTNMRLQFDRDTSTYQSYRFRGNGTQVMTVENREYNGRFRIEGFGVNESGFGAGVSITQLTVTYGDPLPNGWTWDGADYMNLELLSGSGIRYPYYLKGWDDFPGGRITVECIVDTGVR